jgi:hypothetical protein
MFRKPKIYTDIDNWHRDYGYMADDIFNALCPIDNGDCNSYDDEDIEVINKILTSE